MKYFENFQKQIEYINYDEMIQKIHFKRDRFKKFKNKFVIIDDMSLNDLINKCQNINN